MGTISGFTSEWSGTSFTLCPESIYLTIVPAVYEGFTVQSREIQLPQQFRRRPTQEQIALGEGRVSGIRTEPIPWEEINYNSCSCSGVPGSRKHEFHHIELWSLVVRFKSQDLDGSAMIRALLLELKSTKTSLQTGTDGQSCQAQA